MKPKCDIKIMAPVSNEQHLLGAGTHFFFSQVYLEDLEHYVRIVKALAHEGRLARVDVIGLHTKPGPDAR